MLGDILPLQTEVLEEHTFNVPMDATDHGNKGNVDGSQKKLLVDIFIPAYGVAIEYPNAFLFLQRHFNSLKL